MEYKNFPAEAIQSSVKYSVQGITNVIKKYGPREPGSEACYNSQKHMLKELNAVSDEAHFEEFELSPRAFLHFTKIISVIMILAIAAGAVLAFVFNEWLIANWVVFGATAFSLFITLFEFLLYKPFTDRFYKKATGHNLVATRKATGETKKRIIISGHCDSAYEWRHIYYLGGRGMVIFTGSSIVFAIASFVISIVNLVLINTSGANSTLTLALFCVNFVTVLTMVSLFLFVDFKRVVPGANDNLTGTYAAICALRMLEEANVTFENTEVVAIVTDGEEAGLRGAKAWAKTHKDEILNSGVETVFIGVDTLKDLTDFHVYNRDMTGTVQHNKQLSTMVKDAAAETGREMSFANVFFGSSDAAAITQAGLKATCIAAMDPTPAPYYHNRKDTYDALDADAIKAGYEVVISSILKFDREGLPS